MSISKVIYACGLNRRSELVGSIEDKNLSSVISNKEISLRYLSMHSTWSESWTRTGTFS